jgi:hypothetical protein
MIFLVEFWDDKWAVTPELARTILELPDEAAVVRWLADRTKPAYVRRLFDPYGFLWVPRKGCPATPTGGRILVCRDRPGSRQEVARLLAGRSGYSSGDARKARTGGWNV